MKIKINYHKDDIKWKSNWIFIGKNYLNLKKIENKIEGKRLSINEFIHKVFDSQIQKYLAWTERQRNIHKDSQHWWMTDLAGKNNLNSDFYLFICQIYSALELIIHLKKKGEKEILIICDDIFLINTICIFLREKKYDVRVGSNFFVLRNIFKKFKTFFKICISTLNSFYWIIISKIVEKHKVKVNEDEVILIHHSMDVNKFKKDFKLENRYFPHLNNYLKNKKKNIYRLVWFYNFWTNRLEVLKKIKEQSGFIVENYINFKDLIAGITNFLKTKKTILDCENYYDIKTKYLLIKGAMII